MQLLISDANIIIDIEAGKLVNQMFRLEYRFGVPDVLFDLELREQHGHLVTLGLEVMEVKPEAVRYAETLGERYRSAGALDLLALALARQECCPLLSGDKALRQAAKKEGVDVRGTIWLVGEMLQTKVVSRKQAKAAYAAMLNDGRRLPEDEIKKQLDPD